MTVRRRVRRLVKDTNHARWSRHGLSHKRLTTPRTAPAVRFSQMRYTPRMLFVLALVILSRPAAAQCDGKIVASIRVVPRDPSFIRLPRSLRAVARGVGLHHTTTKADVIRRFLLLSVGQACTEQLRAESERILRFQPF